MPMPRPHDLLWLDNPQRLIWRQAMPDWAATQWSAALPLVVRRDSDPSGLVPVGLRGTLRSQRAAAWAPAGAITRIVTPEEPIARLSSGALNGREESRLSSGAPDGLQPYGLAPHQSPGLICGAEALPVMRALRRLAATDWPWPWGVTGSCGYMLATGLPASRPDSDLDLLIRCPRPVAPGDFDALLAVLPALPCRVDIQLETPRGGCALLEWLRGGKVLVKTAHGPELTDNPWDVGPDAG
ncbi:malonate decarboxylase holo-ACP synthase [Acerihabitans arboris]|uniref:Malonate decarboxylase holo-ACP synthase n=1 Tax=Acerihabitans arboris TaxID=2691583 RepID=A0A845SPK1_9GAMM|nr:malonate decarboxylase holo-ACP synthase [Acerihabitans arboris]NDL64458.1 malonate decarboxylase holo-ACP synthase [Acerihabitans arboris]